MKNLGLGLQKTTGFLNVIRMAASRIVQLLNQEDLSKACGTKAHKLIFSIQD